jgi:hypothetical protein
VNVRPHGDDTNSAAALIVSALDREPTDVDNALRGSLHGGDRSDGSLVLHVLEELYQHLGHLELTADAVAARS